MTGEERSDGTSERHAEAKAPRRCSTVTATRDESPVSSCSGKPRTSRT